MLGHAAREQLATDHVILVASTDPAVQSAADYHLDRVDPANIRQHVHATVSENDRIAQAGVGRNSNDPTAPDFGADVFTTDSSPLPLLNHSSAYLDGNQALDTIRDIGHGTGNYAGYRG